MYIYKKDYSLKKGYSKENFLRITLNYSLGGNNIFGNAEKRGYYLYCTPCEKQNKTLLDGTIYTTVSETVGRGLKICIKEVKRQNKKAEQEAIKLAKEKEILLINSVLTRYGLVLEY